MRWLTRSKITSLNHKTGTVGWGVSRAQKQTLLPVCWMLNHLYLLLDLHDAVECTSLVMQGLSKFSGSLFSGTECSKVFRRLWYIVTKLFSARRWLWESSSTNKHNRNNREMNNLPIPWQHDHRQSFPQFQYRRKLCAWPLVPCKSMNRCCESQDPLLGMTRFKFDPVPRSSTSNYRLHGYDFRNSILYLR